MRQETARAAEMRKMVGEFSKSNLRRREFCAKRGMALTTFDYWRRQLRAKPRLVKVEVGRVEAAGQSFTLRLGNGRVIESSFAFDEEELARLIRVAERA
jgi:hypothetical protein